MLDLLIKGGTVIDGSGAARRVADVGITGDHVVAVEPLQDPEAAQVIDAQGKIVAPGFIDMHSHSDFALPFLPTADSKVYQGITLEVVGNCGSSMAPYSTAMIEQHNEIARQESPETVIDWQTFAGFVERLRSNGASLNVAALVGHGTIRQAVMGMTDARPFPDQLKSMKDEVRKAIEAGAIGLSTGLIYTPNVYAATGEIIALAQVAGEMGGLYTTHIRGEANTLIEALQEAVAVGRHAEIAVQVSHLKASGVNNWSKMPQAIEIIERARTDGLDVTADMYPYPASNTGLDSLIPPWVHVGGRDELIARLKDPNTRARIHNELSDPIDANGVGYDGILISSCASHPEYEGRSIQDIAGKQGKHPLDAIMDILIETRASADIIEFTMKEENVALGLKQPFVMIGSDASARATEGPFSRGKPHPRAYGTMPRVLGHYARDERLFSLEEAVRKMTSLPAGKLRLKDRGMLHPGAFADVVIFEPDQVSDTATFADPHQYPAGIEWVFVNGQAVIASGKHTGARPGTVVTL